MFLVYPEWYQNTANKDFTPCISSGYLQEVKNNENYETVSPKRGHGGLGEVIVYESF